MAFPEGWIDSVTFGRNRDQFTAEELRPYWGRHVAWNLEGTQILADGADHKEIYDRLKQLGIDPLLTVDDFVQDPEVSYIGSQLTDFQE